MLLNIIHKIVSYPQLYNISQWIAGVNFNREVIRKEFAELQLSGCIIDVGGGTGLSRTLIPAKWKYFCLDPDPQKLEGFRANYPSDEAIKASACDIPLPNESFDLCIMVAVSHHLTEAEFRRRQGSSFVFKIFLFLKFSGLLYLLGKFPAWLCTPMVAKITRWESNS
jgi:SAM-dependent methyltransferase